MPSDRVYSLSEARTGASSVSPRRRTRQQAARMLPSDPGWLHEHGRSVVLTVQGQPADLFSIGVLAHALGRTPGSVRRLLAAGVLPEAPFRYPGRGPCGQRRLWSREAILETFTVVAELGLVGRRPQRWEGSELASRLRGAATTN